MSCYAVAQCLLKKSNLEKEKEWWNTLTVQFLNKIERLPPWKLKLILSQQPQVTSSCKYMIWISSLISGAYIKYVGGGDGGFSKFSKKIFVAQETIHLNISWPSNFFRKCFMAPPINFSFLFKAYLQQYFRVVLSNIQISNHQRSWHSQ